MRAAAAKNIDLAVIGGGLIGAAIAWGAARRGAHVALLDEGDTALRASRGNFGLVWLQGKGLGAPPYMRWSLRAGRLWQDFDAALAEDCGFDIGWRRPGGFHFCFSDAELEGRRRVAEQTRSAGGDIDIEVIERAQLQKDLPRLGERVAGASYCSQDSHVSPLLLLRALHLSLRRRGGNYRPGFPVDRIEPDGQGFTLSSGGERLGCDKVVVAAGLGGPSLAGQLGIALPVKPERGQIVVTERVAPFFPYAANNLRQTEEGSFLFGSSHEEAGLDDGTDVATAARLVRAAIEVFPALAEASVVRVWGALRILSPDGRPIYQQSPRHPGAFAVTCHSGVTLASVHALDLGPAILAGRLPDDVRTFSSDRFHVQAH
ncbi:NAD(P)/FAD-dependent oxidoreductase [Labrys monachus]|uniref:Glycine/D-amino acid oxidase-like deaminating enzyme n=1 Tax=Labrys monachus TaxID=217067 RepID=A0ABU0FG97_9HYPH|nr:FAD-dependent oxidoreductase [Labrys monachus]MDQ0393641.1 glycine/D-amino acid oxidase-like deaminating enzyme [Labrys monachus]